MKKKTILFIINEKEKEKISLFIKKFSSYSWVLTQSIIWVSASNKWSLFEKKLERTIAKVLPEMVFCMWVSSSSILIKWNFNFYDLKFQRIKKDFVQEWISYTLIPSNWYWYYEKRWLTDFLETTIKWFYDWLLTAQ